MLDFQNLADVHSAIDQIDLLIAGLVAQRDECLRAAAGFADLEAVRPAAQAQAQAQCAPCSGLR